MSDVGIKNQGGISSTAGVVPPEFHVADGLGGIKSEGASLNVVSTRIGDCSGFVGDTAVISDVEAINSVG